MIIDTRTVTTRSHTAVFSAADIRGVALAVVGKQIGIADVNVLSSSAKVGEDGSVTVEIVESVPAAQDDEKEPDPVEVPAAPVLAAPVLQPIAS